MNKIICTQTDFDCGLSEILLWIKNNKRTYNGVYGIPRGGIALALYLSHGLNIPMLAGGITENSLVVDDIADSGNAIRPYLERSKCDVITLYRSKHCQLNPTFWVFDTDKWVVFPWEQHIIQWKEDFLDD